MKTCRPCGQFKNSFCLTEIMHLVQCIDDRLLMLMMCNYYMHRGVYASRVFLRAFPRIKGFQENETDFELSYWFFYVQ